MKAIILAAGEGTRLRPLTNDKPKCLVSYQGKSIIDYQIENFEKSGISEIVIATGYKAEALKGRRVKFAHNSKFDTTNMVYSLFCAERHFDDDLLISYGDIIYERSILQAVLNSRADFAVAVSMNWRSLWEKRMKEPLSDAETLKLDRSGKILEIGKKPTSYEQIDGQYMGLFKISKRYLPAFVKLYKHLDSNALYDGKPYNKMYMTSLIQEVINSGHPVQSVQVTGEWLEIDCPDDLKVELNNFTI